MLANVFACLAYVAEFEIQSRSTNCRRDLHVLMIQHNISGVIKRFPDGRVRLKISAIYRHHAVSFWNALCLDTVKYANVPPVSVSWSFNPYIGSIRAMAIPSGSERNDGLPPSTEDLDEKESIRSPVPSF